MLQGPVVTLTEILRKEKVAVFVVAENGNFVVFEYFATAGLDGLHAGFLFGTYEGYFGMAEFHYRFKSHQALGCLNKGIDRLHAHIAHFDFLQNGIFVGLKIQFDLVVEVEYRLGVVVQVQVEPFAHMARKPHADTLVKVQLQVGPVAHGHQGIVAFGVAKAQVEFEITFGFDFDFLATENGFEKFAIDIKLREQIFLFFLGARFARNSIVDGLEVFLNFFALEEFEILGRRQNAGIGNIVVAQFLFFDIEIGLRVVFVNILDALHLRGDTDGSKDGIASGAVLLLGPKARNHQEKRQEEQ